MAGPGIIPALHGLRGIAVLSVFFYHASLVGILSPVIGRGNGINGVALFFVLSGFLMGFLYLGHRPTARALVDYGRARFARIYPLFAFVVLACATLYSLGAPLVYMIDRPEAVRHLLLFGEVGVFWTISVECQFYALFALVWWAHSRCPIHPDAALAIVLAMTIVALWAHGFPGGRLAITSTGHYFATGLLAALFVKHASARSLRVIGAGLPILLALFFLSWPKVQEAISGIRPDTYGSIWFLALIGLIVIAGATSRSFFARRILGSPVMVYFGEVSFGIYLLHMPVLRFGQLLVEAGVPWQASIAIAAAATLFMANVAHLAIERPARDWLRARAPLKPAAQAI